MPLRRVGHKGAGTIAPGNTLASFDAALAAGVDMIEFDVLPADWRDPAGSPLLLAHDYAQDLGQAPTLEDGLAHFRTAAFGDVELDVDLKLPGYEDRVVAALREAGLVERALVSTMHRSSLRRLRELEPSLRLGWSLPKVERDITVAPLGPRLVAYARITAGRPLLPRRIAAALRGREIDAVMMHWRLVTPRIVRVVHAGGGEIYAWTVDEDARIRRLEEMGVDGVITNDPRLFS